MVDMLKEQIYPYGVHQCVQGPTHSWPGQPDSCIDLVFTNNNELLLSQELIESVIFTDHSLCVIETNITTEIVKNKKPVNNYTTDIPLYNLLKADDKDWDALNNEFLTVNWDEEVLNKDMDELTDAFIKVIEDKVKIVMRNKSMEKNHA